MKPRKIVKVISLAGTEKEIQARLDKITNAVPTICVDKARPRGNMLFLECDESDEHLRFSYKSGFKVIKEELTDSQKIEERCNEFLRLNEGNITFKKIIPKEVGEKVCAILWYVVHENVEIVESEKINEDGTITKVVKR